MEWDQAERDAIIRFFWAWWRYDVNYGSYFEHNVFIELYKILRELPLMLSDWSLEITSNGYSNFIDFVEVYYADLYNNRKVIFKELEQNDKELLKEWIKESAKKIEEGYLYFESRDFELTERISNTLYIVEQIK
ncbi:hypothetical protein V6R21_06765 [Limibacter armeniacum]|uniref:hypothetical protein n=1 Tax=Limibacter armeniacum TaxID=466084 RepID=UPI002FE53BC9